MQNVGIIEDGIITNIIVLPDDIDPELFGAVEIPEDAKIGDKYFTLEERIAMLEAENAKLQAHLSVSDEAAIDLYEAHLDQAIINAEQDEAIIEIYEMMEGTMNG